jgi:hypothetical protein
MPFGQPIQPSSERRACGCLVEHPGERHETIVSHCAEHFAALPAEKQAELRRLKWSSLVDGLFGLLLRLAMVALVGFMIWTVWSGLQGG